MKKPAKKTVVVKRPARSVRVARKAPSVATLAAQVAALRRELKKRNIAKPVVAKKPQAKRATKAAVKKPLARKNPVKKLPIGAAEIAQIRKEVQKNMSGRGAALREAAKRYADFTGHDDPQVTRVNVPEWPKEIFAIGTLDAVMYTTVRDGKTEKYIHKFAAKSRPLLASSSDGKALLVVGGRYNFTDRGIVDKTR